MLRLLLILLLALVLRIPSLFEPYWYGDEGIYLTIGHAIRQGLQLYTQIHDNKPPLLYLIAAAADGSQVWFRTITLVWNLLTVMIFWKLAHLWFKSQDTATWASVIFVLLTSLPIIEGNVANAEIFFLGLTTLAFYLAYQTKKIFWAGLIIGIAALFKMPAILEVGVWPILWLVTGVSGWLRKSLTIGIGAMLPILLSLGYYGLQGNLDNYLIAAGLQNIPYLSSWQAVSGLVGTLSGRGAILGVALACILIVRNRLSHPNLILGIWWVIGTFAILLSGRPYPHYILQMAAAISLALATLWKEDWREKWPAGIALVVLGGLLVTFHFYSYPTLSYYHNFIKFIFQQQTSTDYFNYFNPNTSRNYEISQIISDGSLPQDRLFIWGDEPMIYALTKRLPVGRFTVRYHIEDFRAHQETVISLQQTPPKYVVVITPVSQLPGLEELLAEKYILEKNVQGVKIYRRTEGILQARNSIIRL